MDQYKLQVNIYPIHQNQRIRVEASNLFRLFPLVEHLRLTEHRIQGYYEGNLNMRLLHELFKRAQRQSSEFTVNVHPLLLLKFKAWNDKRLSLLAKKKLEDVELDYFQADELWPFQRVDANFLVNAEEGFLAHEMGLGKTVITCTTIEVWRKKFPKEMRHGLIICPTNGIYSWRDHLLGSGTTKQWTTYDRSQVLTADNASSMDRLLPILVARSDPWDGVLIINWETLRNDRCAKLLTNFHWSYIVADEVHRARNLAAKQSKNFLQTHGQRKLALSGTGVVNKGGDMFAIVNWLKPAEYDNMQVFEEDFVDQPKKIVAEFAGNTYSQREVDAIEQELDYIMVRREKKDVLKDLPEKVISDIHLPLNRFQRKQYEQMRDEFLVALTDSDDDIVNATVVIAQLMRLKQIAISPALIKAAQPPLSTQRQIKYADVRDFDDSAKFDWLMDYIEETEPYEKLVIFSQFESALKILEARIRNSDYWQKEHPYGYARFTGSSCGYVPFGQAEFLRVQTAKDLQDIFQTDSTTKLWLGSLKASGELLTLTASSTVVALDQWWNDASMQQAYDRIHRIGQKNVARIIRLIAEDTVEQDILEIIEAKKSEFSSMIRTRQFLIELLMRDKERTKEKKAA